MTHWWQFLLETLVALGLTHWLTEPSHVTVTVHLHLWLHDARQAALDKENQPE